MSLLVGGITQRVPEAEVMAIPEPPFTKSWHPISHGRLINALNDSVKSAGLSVRNREYSLNETGTKMFGVWQLFGSQSLGRDWAVSDPNCPVPSERLGSWDQKLD